MLRIVAIYRGRSGHRGFEYGKQYTLGVKNHEVIRLDDTGRITYNSIEGLVSDWQIVGSD